MSQKHEGVTWMLSEHWDDTTLKCVDTYGHGALATVVWRMEDDKVSPRCRGNAYLIQAAPALLSACKFALADLKEIMPTIDPTVQGHSGWDTIEHLEQTIRHAETGGEHDLDD